MSNFLFLHQMQWFLGLFVPKNIFKSLLQLLLIVCIWGNMKCFLPKYKNSDFFQILRNYLFFGSENFITKYIKYKKILKTYLAIWYSFTCNFFCNSCHCNYIHFSRYLYTIPYSKCVQRNENHICWYNKITLYNKSHGPIVQCSHWSTNIHSR